MLSAPETRTFRLSAGGVECDEKGLRVAGAPLLTLSCASVACRDWRPLPPPEIDRALSRVYGVDICAQDKRKGLEVVAAALGKGELARAQIAALLLRLPDPALAKIDAKGRSALLIGLRESGLLAKDWNEADHPRTGTPPNAGWFAPKTDAGAAAPQPANGDRPSGVKTRDGREYALAGVLIDDRYDKASNFTHCTYSTPLGMFTIAYPNYQKCDPTFPYPY
jgi:hypothetical protein